MGSLSRFSKRQRKQRPHAIPGVLTYFGRRNPQLVADLFIGRADWIETPEDLPMGSLSRFSTSDSNFIRQEDVAAAGGYLRLTIVGTGEHAFEGEATPKLTLRFQETPKMFSANKTNVGLLQIHLHVTEEEQLLGRQIEIYYDPTVQMRGQIVGGLRIRAPQAGYQPQASAPPTQQPMPTQPTQQPAMATQQPAPQPMQQQAFQGPAPSQQQAQQAAEQQFQQSAQDAPWNG